MEKLLLFVSKDDQKIVMDAYTLDSKTYKKDAYVLKDDMLKDEDKEEKLIDILGKPMLLVSGFDSDSETSKQMKRQYLRMCLRRCLRRIQRYTMYFL